MGHMGVLCVLICGVSGEVSGEVSSEGAKMSTNRLSPITVAICNCTLRF